VRPSRAHTRAALPTTAACAALYAASIATLLLSHLGHGWPFVDLDVYRRAGQAVLEGSDLYRLRFPGALAFTYPPLSALLFTAFVPLRMSLLEPLITAANVLLLPITLLLALRLEPARAWFTRGQAARLALIAAAGALWLEPVWTALRYGQIDLLIAALVLYDLSRNPASRWQGAATGLAAGLKLTPAIFVLYLLLTRRFRAAVISLVTFAFTVLIGFVVIPRDASAFWGGAFADPSRVGRPENAANQSLRGAYVRLLHSLSVSPAWILTAIAVGALGIALATRAGRRGDDARGFSLCALTALLVSPVSWSHHWAIAVPALLLAGVGAVRDRSTMALVAFAAAAAIGLSHVIWWVPVNHPRHSELHLDALQLLCSSAYVLIGALALGVAALSAAGRAPPAARLVP
jgi:alpha-1,2-mannosyltransferase